MTAFATFAAAFAAARRTSALSRQMQAAARWPRAYPLFFVNSRRHGGVAHTASAARTLLIYIGASEAEGAHARHGIDFSEKKKEQDDKEIAFTPAALPADGHGLRTAQTADGRRLLQRHGAAAQHALFTARQGTAPPACVLRTGRKQ